jgi:hypothetical protein
VIVVADSSPLIALAKIGCFDPLRKLLSPASHFGRRYLLNNSGIVEGRGELGRAALKHC